jgi:two-component system chemotaxis sensor kinase CheA
MNMDLMRAQLMPIFLEEMEGQVARFAANLPAGPDEPVDADRLRSLFRVAHTLKGAAHAVGVVPIERVCRALEVTLTMAADGRATIDPDHHAFLLASAEALRDACARLRSGQELTHSLVTALAARGPK